MKLTRSVSYALAILLRVHEERNGPVTARRISKGCRFPPRFLYRVLRRLVDAGLLVGVSGPGGGYALARPASRITVLDIVAAIDGMPAATRLEAVSPKHRQAVRTLNALSTRQADWIQRELRKVNLARLARG